jgi:hypothetical protein
METTTNTDLVDRLRKRAMIRRQIPTRKSVLEGAPDRIADLLEEAANEIERLSNMEEKTSNNIPIIPKKSFFEFEEKCTAVSDHQLCYRVRCNLAKRCYVKEQENATK